MHLQIAYASVSMQELRWQRVQNHNKGRKSKVCRQTHLWSSCSAAPWLAASSATPALALGPPSCMLNSGPRAPRVASSSSCWLAAGHTWCQMHVLQVVAGAARAKAGCTQHFSSCWTQGRTKTSFSNGTMCAYLPAACETCCRCGHTHWPAPQALHTAAARLWWQWRERIQFRFPVSFSRVGGSFCRIVRRSWRR